MALVSAQGDRRPHGLQVRDHGRMREKLRGSLTEVEQADLENCTRELATVETMMDAAGQEP